MSPTTASPRRIASRASAGVSRSKPARASARSSSILMRATLPDGRRVLDVAREPGDAAPAHLHGRRVDVAAVQEPAALVELVGEQRRARVRVQSVGPDDRPTSGQGQRMRGHVAIDQPLVTRSQIVYRNPPVARTAGTLPGDPATREAAIAEAVVQRDLAPVTADAGEERCPVGFRPGDELRDRIPCNCVATRDAARPRRRRRRAGYQEGDEKYSGELLHNARPG